MRVLQPLPLPKVHGSVARQTKQGMIIRIIAAAGGAKVRLPQLLVRPVRCRLQGFLQEQLGGHVLGKRLEANDLLGLVELLRQKLRPQQDIGQHTDRVGHAWSEQIDAVNRLLAARGHESRSTPVLQLVRDCRGAVVRCAARSRTAGRKGRQFQQVGNAGIDTGSLVARSELRHNPDRADLYVRFLRHNANAVL